LDIAVALAASCLGARKSRREPLDTTKRELF